MSLKRSVRSFCEGYFSTCERSEKTYRAYRCDLHQFSKYIGPRKQLRCILPEDIERWAAHLRQDGYAPASIQRKMAALRTFFRYWVRRGSIDTSPLWRVRLSFSRGRQLPRCLSKAEIRRLLRHAEKAARKADEPFDAPSDRAFLSLRNLALIDLLFATGIRVGEANQLDLASYHTDDRTFFIHGKGGRHRLAFLTEKNTIDIQRRYLKARAEIPASTNALFLNRLGGRLTTAGMANVVRTLSTDAGIKQHVTPHMLRHTVATLLLRNGVDLRVVQEFLGHASITSTQRYTHLSKHHMLSVLRKRHPALGLRVG